MSMNNYSIKPETNWFYFTPSSDCLSCETTCNFLKQVLNMNSTYPFDKPNMLKGNVSRAYVALYYREEFLIGSGMLYPKKASSKGGFYLCNSNSAITIPGLAKLAFSFLEHKSEGIEVRIIYAMKATALDLDEFENEPKFHRFNDHESLLEPMMTPIFSNVITKTLKDWSFIQIVKICCPARFFEDEHFLLFLQSFMILSNVLIAVRKKGPQDVKGFYSVSNFHSLSLGDDYVQIVCIAPQNVPVFHDGYNIEIMHVAMKQLAVDDAYFTIQSDIIDTWKSLELLSENPPKKVTPCADGLPSFFYILPRMVTILARKWHLDHDSIAYSGERKSLGKAEPKPKATPRKKKFVQRAIKPDTPADIVEMINGLYQCGKDASLVFSEYLESQQLAEKVDVKTEQVSKVLSHDLTSHDLSSHHSLFESDEESDEEVEWIPKSKTKKRKRNKVEESSETPEAKPDAKNKKGKKPSKNGLNEIKSAGIKNIPSWAKKHKSRRSSSSYSSSSDEEETGTPSSSRSTGRRNGRRNARK